MGNNSFFYCQYVEHFIIKPCSYAQRLAELRLCYSVSRCYSSPCPDTRERDAVLRWLDQSVMTELQS